MKTQIATVLLLAIFSVSFSQSPLGKLRLPAVDRDDFYRIELPAVYSGYFREDYGNLRISDGSEHEVPYITGEAIQTAQTKFRPYEILEKEHRRGCCTRVVFRAEETISNIHLRIRNADARKRASLLGSDDMEHWFILKQRFDLSYVNGKENTSEIRIVDFPLSNYAFYRVDIDDSVTAPLNILAVGSYEQSPESKTYVPVSTGKIRVEEAERKTRIRLEWDGLQRIDRVVLSASGQPLFRRNVELYSTGHEAKSGRRDKRRWLKSFELSSEGPAVVDVAIPLSESLEAVIDNHDSPPLQIDSVGVFQVKHFLVAFLRAGKSYDLVIHGKGMQPPLYDLQAFRNKLTGDMSVVLPEKELLGVNVQSTRRFFSPELMWAAIILIIVVLGFYSYRIVRESRVS